MDPLLVDLLSVVDKSSRKLDRDRIISAWELANLAHSGQMRLSGDPYITHPTTVAKSIVSWGLDTDAVMAALLHDTVEDGGATRDDIVTHFGEEVAQIVDGVTKITDIRLTGSAEEKFIENLRKMLLVMARDLRVIIVKLADRLHNMQTLKYLPLEKQVVNARETLEIYAPLAERLGIGIIKGKLEDLAFPYVYPDQYQHFIHDSTPYYAKAQKYVEILKKQLISTLEKDIPSVTVKTRLKHHYSAWRKLHRPGIDGDWSKLYDLIAGRVLVDTVAECYLSLGLIHGKYHVVPYLGISDFIATPKANGYRSLHTRIFGPEGRIIEIQIRTREMHEQAEMGVAAHWHYSETKSSGASVEKLVAGQVFAPVDKLNWVKQLMSWQNQITDNQEYLRTLKFDALQHRILVFSPKGDVFDLPYGATPIDFAFAVHTGLGNQTVGAKVNDKAVSLDSKLANGDVVEIMTNSKNKKPNLKWLDFVVTAAARHAINKFINNQI